MDSETIIQLLILLLWIFGGKILRTLRGEEAKPEQDVEDDLEEWGDEWKLPEEPVREVKAPSTAEEVDLPNQITTLEELHDLETKLEEVNKVAQKPVPQEYQAIAHLLDVYDRSQRSDERPSPVPPTHSSPRQELPPFSEKTTRKAVLLDGFLLSEIMGSPRAYRPLKVKGADRAPRVVRKL